uniref:Uncharacterized protein n=1 Tax=Actinoplanes sp. A40644 TaxID=236489 RepID=Q767G3_9ACTN|nr:hypothetical protein [Actinoplanes sp. A40644]
MSRAQVIGLQQPGEVDPAGVLGGPVRGIRRVQLAAGEQRLLSSPGTETTLFVLDGDGDAHSGGTTAALTRGVSVTVPLETELRITAGAGGIEYFAVVLAVPETER